MPASASPSRRRHNRRPIVFSSDIIDSITRAYEELEPEVDDRLDALRQCMDQLNARHRRVIELRYARQLSQDDIAAQGGSNGRAVNAMLFRIRTALRECVSKKIGETR